MGEIYVEEIYKDGKRVKMQYVSEDPEKEVVRESDPENFVKKCLEQKVEYFINYMQESTITWENQSPISFKREFNYAELNNLAQYLSKHMKE